MKKLAPALSAWILENIDPAELADIGELEADYLRGKGAISLRRLEELSRRTRMPVNYFLVSTPPEEELPFHACGGGSSAKPSRELIDLLDQMQAIQGWMRDQRLRDSMDPLEIVGGMGADGVPQALRRLRGYLEVGAEWFEEIKDRSGFDVLRDKIGSLGVTVMTDTEAGRDDPRRLDPEEFRAFALCDDQAPIIFVNGNDTRGGRLYSLVYEFARICLGQEDILRGRPEERGAEDEESEKQFFDAVTELFLVPWEGFAEAWADVAAGRGAAEACKLLSERRYRCGPTVVARRALRSGFIDEAACQTAARMEREEDLRDREENRAGKGDCGEEALIRYRLSERFVRMVATSVANGATSFTQAFRLTGATSRSFFRLAALSGAPGFD